MSTTIIVKNTSEKETQFDSSESPSRRKNFVQKNSNLKHKSSPNFKLNTIPISSETDSSSDITSPSRQTSSSNSLISPSRSESQSSESTPTSSSKKTTPSKTPFATCLQSPHPSKLPPPSPSFSATVSRSGGSTVETAPSTPIKEEQTTTTTVGRHTAPARTQSMTAMHAKPKKIVSKKLDFGGNTATVQTEQEKKEDKEPVKQYRILMRPQPLPTQAVQQQPSNTNVNSNNNNNSSSSGSSPAASVVIVGESHKQGLESTNISTGIANTNTTTSTMTKTVVKESSTGPSPASASPHASSPGSTSPKRTASPPAKASTPPPQHQQFLVHSPASPTVHKVHPQPSLQPVVLSPHQLSPHKLSPHQLMYPMPMYYPTNYFYGAPPGFPPMGFPQQQQGGFPPTSPNHNPPSPQLIQGQQGELPNLDQMSSDLHRALNLNAKSNAVTTNAG